MNAPLERVAVVPVDAAMRIVRELAELQNSDLQDADLVKLERLTDEAAALARVEGPVAPKLAVCPDGCWRPKAKSADDAAAGCCSKWWAIRDQGAKDECVKLAAFWKLPQAARDQLIAAPPQAPAAQGDEAPGVVSKLVAALAQCEFALRTLLPNDADAVVSARMAWEALDHYAKTPATPAQSASGLSDAERRFTNMLAADGTPAMIDAWNELRRLSQPQAVGDGVWVPREPTPKMIDAGFDALPLHELDHGYPDGDAARTAVYKAYLAAANAGQAVVNGDFPPAAIKVLAPVAATIRELARSMSAKDARLRSCAINVEAVCEGLRVFSEPTVAAEDAKDAARYRWLKEHGIIRVKPLSSGMMSRGGSRIWADSPAWLPGDFTYVVDEVTHDVDTAIDGALARAAMQRQAGEK